MLFYPAFFYQYEAPIGAGGAFLFGQLMTGKICKRAASGFGLCGHILLRCHPYGALELSMIINSTKMSPLQGFGVLYCWGFYRY
jgi:hypothetical protein